MKGFVTIDSCLINEEDLMVLNDQGEDISYNLVKSSGFLSSEVILVLVNLVENIGYNAAYDLLKSAILKITMLIKRKKEFHTDFQFEISCNGSVFSLKGNKELTEQQMDKLVDAAVKVLISEWKSGEKDDEQ